MRGITGILFAIFLAAPAYAETDDATAAGAEDKAIEAPERELTEKERKKKERAERRQRKAEERAAKDQAIRCSRRARTGSHFRSTRCTTNAQRRAEREEAERQLKRTQGSVVGSN